MTGAHNGKERPTSITIRRRLHLRSVYVYTIAVCDVM